MHRVRSLDGRRSPRRRLRRTCTRAPSSAREPTSGHGFGVAWTTIMRTLLAAPALLLLSASTARAGDAFEIQVYDGTANPVGVPGVELHLNEWATGHHD